MVYYLFILYQIPIGQFQIEIDITGYDYVLDSKRKPRND